VPKVLISRQRCASTGNGSALGPRAQAGEEARWGGLRFRGVLAMHRRRDPALQTSPPARPQQRMGNQSRPRPQVLVDAARATRPAPSPDSAGEQERSAARSGPRNGGRMTPPFAPTEASGHSSGGRIEIWLRGHHQDERWCRDRLVQAAEGRMGA
jgi:hypothetical protein